MNSGTIDSYIKVHHFPAVEGTTIVSRIEVTVPHAPIFEGVAVH
jgi:hypothetical protein